MSWFEKVVQSKQIDSRDMKVKIPRICYYLKNSANISEMSRFLSIDKEKDSWIQGNSAFSLLDEVFQTFQPKWKGMNFYIIELALTQQKRTFVKVLFSAIL